MEHKFVYQFGSEWYTYEPTYEEMEEFLLPIISYEEKKTMGQVQELFEDDEYFNKKVKEYNTPLEKYLETYAEWEYEQVLNEAQTRDDCEDDYCPSPESRSRNLLGGRW